MEKRKIAANQISAQNNYNEYQVQETCRLMDFLYKIMPDSSKSKLKAILAGKGICVNKRTITQYDFELRPGMVVQISKHKRKTDLESPYVKIVYEDKWLVVIEKNVGILSMANKGSQFCVKSVLDQYFKRKHLKCTAHVVHRLDRETSGLMIYAKDIKAEQILEHNWHDIVTDRRYVAVVDGRMERKSGDVESWLKDNKAYVTYSSDTDNGGKYALTHFKTLMSNDNYSLVELKLETGRKNQIRVHMQDIGHPVVGDIKYGNMGNPLHRLALHAFRLFFYHPITGEQMEFETPVPTPFKKLFP